MGGALFAAGWLGLCALAHLSGVLGDLHCAAALLLVGTTGVAAICAAFDQAVIGMGISSLQMRRNVVASIVRIAVFAGAIGLGVRSGQAVLVSWTVGLVGSLLATPLRRYLPPRARVTVRTTFALGAKPLARGDGPSRSHIGSGDRLALLFQSLLRR